MHTHTPPRARARRARGAQGDLRHGRSPGQGRHHSSILRGSGIAGFKAFQKLFDLRAHSTASVLVSLATSFGLTDALDGRLMIGQGPVLLWCIAITALGAG